MAVKPITLPTQTELDRRALAKLLTKKQLYFIDDMNYVVRANSPNTYEVVGVIGENGEIVWGQIGGLMSNQTDLTLALADKSDVGHTHEPDHTHANKAILDEIIDSGDGLKYFGDDGDYHDVPGGVGGSDYEYISDGIPT